MCCALLDRYTLNYLSKSLVKFRLFFYAAYFIKFLEYYIKEKTVFLFIVCKRYYLHVFRIERKTTDGNIYRKLFSFQSSVISTFSQFFSLNLNVLFFMYLYFKTKPLHCKIVNELTKESYSMATCCAITTKFYRHSLLYWCNKI